MPNTSKLANAPDLYCITDPVLAGLPHEEQVVRMIDGGAPIVQLRDKNLSDVDYLLAAQRCMMVCRRGGALFIVNDRVDVAAAIGADGVHLGQGDARPVEARMRLGLHAVIGLSTHNLEQFRRALDEPINYLALGPVYGTTTKQNADPAVGLATVKAAIALMKSDHRPLVLIGGITMERLPEIRRVAPKALVAVIGDVLRGGRIAERVREFRAALGANAGKP